MKKLFAFTTLCLAAACAFAQSWPARTVTLIVPFSAGGGTDVGARLIAAKLSQKWGQTVVVDNWAAHGHRGGRGRQGQARRLHALGRQRRHAGDQPGALQEAAVQPRHRVRADLDGGRAAVRAAGRTVGGGEDAEGAGRRRQGAAGQGHLRQLGLGRLAAPDGRNLRGGCRRPASCTCRTRAAARRWT